MKEQGINSLNFDSFNINLELLPKNVQQELIDYYLFLINKYEPQRKKNTKKEIFLASVAKHKFSLPANYKFDREAANER